MPSRAFSLGVFALVLLCAIAPASASVDVKIFDVAIGFPDSLTMQIIYQHLIDSGSGLGTATATLLNISETDGASVVQSFDFAAQAWTFSPIIYSIVNAVDTLTGFFTATTQVTVGASTIPTTLQFVFQVVYQQTNVLEESWNKGSLVWFLTITDWPFLTAGNSLTMSWGFANNFVPGNGNDNAETKFSDESVHMSNQGSKVAFFFDDESYLAQMSSATLIETDQDFNLLWNPTEQVLQLAGIERSSQAITLYGGVSSSAPGHRVVVQSSNKEGAIGAAIALAVVLCCVLTVLCIFCGFCCWIWCADAGGRSSVRKEYGASALKV